MAESKSELVLTEICENGLAVITLNRPKALNAGNLELVTALCAVLKQCASNDKIVAVLVQGAGGRAFCAGGDVKSLAEVIETEGRKSDMPVEHFVQEFNGVYAMQQCPKPTISFLDGVVMGYGLGLGCSARYRLVTEKSRFAMPENNIGLFPDALFSYLASKMPPGIGHLMACTGIHVRNPADALWAGIGTHFLHSEKLPAVMEALRSAKLNSTSDADKVIRSCIEGLAESAPDKKGILQGVWGQRFAQCKGPAEVLEQLKAAKERDKEASELYDSMIKGSPFSQCLSWHLIDQANAELSKVDDLSHLSAALERDFAAICRMLYRPDFVEGVRATLVAKDGNAKWKPANYAQVSMEEVRAVAAPLPQEHRQLGLRTSKL